MRLRRFTSLAGIGLVAALATATRGEKPRPAATSSSAVQPVAETLDLEMYARIRDQAFNHSHVMDYAGALFDDIGPRLTGSPAMARANDWTRQQLAAMGCANAHLESWGEFGMAWTQLGSSLQMVTPSTATFLAQASPWSPSTSGIVTAEAVYVHGITDEAGMAAYKGKLKGKVIVYGQSAVSPDVDPDKVPAMEHYDAAKLAAIAQYPLNGDMSEQGVISATTAALIAGFFKQNALKEKVGKFFVDEGAIAILVPGGSGGVLHDDTNSSMGWFVYRADHKQVIPEEVISTEAWDRLSRLLDHKVPVTLKVGIATQFGDEHARGYNTIAEIPGTDPKLKDEVVMVGGHLDSWIAGTGATDNGAGTITAMEAMRILNSLHVRPRRTIRIALWSGEEQGIFGSAGYVSSHFATLHTSTAKEDADVPTFLLPMTAPPTYKPEAARLDAYFNMDNGTGKLLGVYTEGDAGVSSIFAQWIQPLADLGMTTLSERNTGGTDHLPFQQIGLPGFQFIQDPRDYESRTHHTNLDTYEHLSEPDLKQAAAIEAIFLYNAAMRDQMLPRPELPFAGVEKPLEGLYPDAAK